MATFVEIRTRVQRRLIDAPASVTAEIPDLVKEAHKELQERHNFKAMETETAQLVTTLATRVLAAVPVVDWKEHRGKPYMVRFDGTTKRLILAVNRAAALTAFSLSDANDDGEPQVISLSEPDDDGLHNFEVWPFPDGNSDWSDGNYRIVVPYYRFFTPLSADGDDDWITVNAARWLVEKAASEGFFLDWDEQRGAVWDAKAERSLKRVVNLDKRLRWSGMQTLVPHKDVNDIELEY